MKNIHRINGNIYITNDEEIKEGDCILFQGVLTKALKGEKFSGKEKIILTTDQSLNGVQAIDDEFLEWFVKNPSCEEVEVYLVSVNEFGSEVTVSGYGFDKFIYKIIFPKEEPKQEISYSGEDMKFAYEQGARLALLSQSPLARHKGEFPNPDEWFEQFKEVIIW